MNYPRSNSHYLVRLIVNRSEFVKRISDILGNYQTNMTGIQDIKHFLHSLAFDKAMLCFPCIASQFMKLCLPFTTYCLTVYEAMPRFYYTALQFMKLYLAFPA